VEAKDNPFETFLDVFFLIDIVRIGTNVQMTDNGLDLTLLYAFDARP
jgi:hypothetical protein